MREREVAAAVAGLVGAVAAHALDTAGLLPGVHETAAVRGAMSPLLTTGWLMAAACLGWLAAATRPLLVAPASALLVSACPELVGRHDAGALAEPGALAGALLQSLLVLAVLALGVVASRRLQLLALPVAPRPHGPPLVVVQAVGFPRNVGRRGRPRAPPAASFH